jgi:chromosome segregation ATPase
MAISYSIDGTSDSSVNQIFDLLAVMADPKAYNEKLQALQTAVAENKKYVDLVGPANDIMMLREKADTELAEARDQAKQMREEADGVLAEAKTEAKAIVAEASKKASESKAAAKKLEEDAKRKNDDLDVKISNLAAQQAALDADKKSVEKMAEMALAERQEAIKQQEAAKAERDAVIAKHKALIESLA